MKFITSILFSLVLNFSSAQTIKVYYKHQAGNTVQTTKHDLIYKVSRDTIACDSYPIVSDSLTVKFYLRSKNKKWIHRNDDGSFEECCFKRAKEPLINYFDFKYYLVEKVECKQKTE